MAKGRWFLKEPRYSEGGMLAFRQQLLLFLAIATFYGSWFLVPWTIDLPGSTPLQIAAIACGLALAIVTYGLRMKWPLLASWLYTWGSLGFFAASFMATLPTLVVFLLLQRHFVSGITAGAVRG